MTLRQRLMDALEDGRPRTLAYLADVTGESVGDVRACLTTAWEQGAEIDADDVRGLPDWLWWRTDALPPYRDHALLFAVGMVRGGARAADLAPMMGVTRATMAQRLRTAREYGYVETTGRTVATRYHLTAAGRAALESK